jgi:glycosyltransferase involved in cell wall biosynthesis
MLVLRGLIVTTMERWSDLILLFIDVSQRSLGIVVSSVRFFTTPLQAKIMRTGVFYIDLHAKVVGIVLMLVIFILPMVFLSLLIGDYFPGSEEINTSNYIVYWSLLPLSFAVGVTLYRKYILDIYLLATARAAYLAALSLFSAALIYIFQENLISSFFISSIILFALSFITVRYYSNGQKIEEKGVVFITVSAGGGGAEKTAERLRCEFKDRNESFLWVSILGGHFDNSNKPDIQLDGRRVLYSVLRIYALLFKYRNYNVYSNLTYLNVATIFLWSLIPYKKGKLRAIEHNVLFYTEANSSKRYLRGFILSKISFLFYRLSNTEVMCVSEGVASDFLSVGVKNVSIFNNPFPAEINKRSINRTVDCSNFAFIGALSEQKNLPELIYAFSNLLNKIDLDSKLYILGEGSLSSSIKHLVASSGLSERIILLGQQKLPYLTLDQLGVRTVVVTSRWEGYCLVVEEAIISGFDVIVSNCHYGPSSIVDYYKVGRIYNLGSIEALSDCMLSSLADRNFKEFNPDILSKDIFNRGYNNFSSDRDFYEVFN